MSAQAAAILRAARARIAEPEHWCQGAWARDTFGSPVRADHPYAAASICPVNAVSLAAGSGVDRIDALCCLYASAPDGESFLGWNDAPERKHMDVLAVLDAAISLAEGAQP